MMTPSIYDYIKQEETNFEADEIQLGENWFWNFRRHVQLIFHLKNGIFYTGENNWLRAFKNIMEPILNLSYWTEDIEVKDGVFYIENEKGKILSFLFKKYHDEIYVKEHDLEILFDEITETDIDYGGVLVQKGVERPEVLQLNSIAFCDQTDILGGPVGFKFYFTPTKLKGMSDFGWGKKENGATISLEELCLLATYEKDPVGTLNKKTNQVPGKTIEVYIIRGNLPNHYLYDDDDMDYQSEQVQIIAFYKDKEGKQQGVTLYRKENEGNIKFFTSKKVYGRALGRGVGESLLHPQIWTNFLTIHKTALLEAASKVPLYTDDPAYANRQKIQDMENLEITTIEENKRIYQVPTAAPTNIQLYANDINQWFEHAQFSGAAFDPILGKEAASGTTFRGQERTVAQGKGLHDKRRGQRAKFIEEIYREWIIPEIKKEILRGKEFLATLTSDELRWIKDEMAENYASRIQLDMVLDGKQPQGMTFEQHKELLKQQFSEDFLKKGNKHLIKILKDEFRDVEIKLGISVGNKQKNLADLSDKVLSIFQFVFQNPQAFIQAMQIPALAKSFENILEFSGLSIADFSSLMNAPIQPQQIQQAQPAQPAQNPLAVNQI